MGKELIVSGDDFGGKGLAVPDYLQSAPSVVENVEVSLSALRISIDKNRFTLREGRSEVQKLGKESIQVRFVHIHPTIQRTYYTEAYDPDSEEVAIPACWSNDGKTPSSLSVDPQADACAECPMNKKGSGNGGSRKACGQSRNTAVTIFNEQGAESDEPAILRINATSHYADPTEDGDGTMNFNKLLKLATRHGLPLQAYPVEVAFDEEGENGQLVFYVENQPASKERFDEIQEMREGDALDELCRLDFQPEEEDGTSAQRAEAPKTRRKKKAAAKAAEPAATKQPESGGESEGEGDEPAPSKSRTKRRGNRGAAKANAAAQTDGVDEDDSDDGGDMGDPELEDLLGGVEDLD